MVQSMRELEQSDTGSGLPVVQGTANQRPSLARSSAAPAFLSQLIAARDRLVTQRRGRLETSQGAVGAYGKGARIAERRMPLGYRKSKIV